MNTNKNSRVVKDRVIIRRVKEDQSLIAFYIDQEEDIGCNSYMYIGEHCAASLDFYRNRTSPVGDDEEDVQSFKKVLENHQQYMNELCSQSVKLEFVKRWSR